MEAGINPILEVSCAKRSQPVGPRGASGPGGLRGGSPGGAVWDRMTPHWDPAWGTKEVSQGTEGSTPSLPAGSQVNLRETG